MDRRDLSMNNNSTVKQKERIEDIKINNILQNLEVLNLSPIYSAEPQKKAIKDLAQDAINKINIAYNEVVPV